MKVIELYTEDTEETSRLKLFFTIELAYRELINIIIVSNLKNVLIDTQEQVEEELNSRSFWTQTVVCQNERYIFALTEKSVH